MLTRSGFLQGASASSSDEGHDTGQAPRGRKVTPWALLSTRDSTRGPGARRRGEEERPMMWRQKGGCGRAPKARFFSAECLSKALALGGGVTWGRGFHRRWDVLTLRAPCSNSASQGHV